MYSVILVDDNPWALADIRETFGFADFGFDIIGEFFNAEDALDMILKQPPTLIVADICMEKLSGLDMARLCRQNGIHSLFVLVSGYERFEYAQAALRYDIFDYLLKPLDDAKVREVMRRLSEHLEKEGAPHAGGQHDSLVLARKFIDERYSESISLDDVARYTHVNKSYLSELFTKRLGVSFTRYKNGIRIHHAKSMIRLGSMSMTEVALASGFENLSRFSKVFKQIEGITPMQYRAKERAPGDGNGSLLAE